MSEAPSQRDLAHMAILDLFATSTRLPIGLYEFQNGNLNGIFSEYSLANFEPHCRLIQSFPGGKARCEADQCNRAHIALRSRREELTPCHAGLYNQAVPIHVKGEVRAVLLYGEMQIEGEEYQQAALANHERTVQAMGLTEDQTVQLRNLLLSAKKYSPEQLAYFKNALQTVEQYIYTLVDHENQQKRNTDKITHELQTRLQAVIAGAENLTEEIHELSPEQARAMAYDVLHASLALATVVQNLGDYLGEYRFRKEPIAALLFEAKRLYEAEATRRDITIDIRLQGDSNLEISRDHMQYALNNMVHNAVKYSFRGGPGRHRYVLITGAPQNDYYALSIRNYGVGILAQEIDSSAIFRDGYQGKLTQGEYRTGSGKGLSFVKRIIDRHHGSIHVESRLVADQDSPEGQPHLTRFTLHLPFVQPKED